MEFELWWLLALPLFFALGWLAARVDIRQVVTESRALPNAYFRGVNFLLNEQPDRAIEAFLEVVKLEPETIDLHFALGGLFRRRGEFDRAIRMHEHLLEREGLDAEQRLRALAELGQDYLKAGLLDRAEQTFTRLLDTPRRAEARAALLEIQVQARDWLQAIETARQLESETHRPFASEIAHFHCELAQLAAARGAMEEATRELELALQSNRQSVRASLMAGDLAAAAGRHEEALAHWRLIEAQNPAYLPLVVERMQGSFRELGRAQEGVHWLRALHARHPSTETFNALYLAVSEREGSSAARQLAQEELRRAPTLRTLDRHLEAQLVEAPPESREMLQIEKNLIAAHSQRAMRYHCASCGFKARQFYWRCPACGRWDSFDPERREADAA